jgi:hypothetical protein
LGPFAKQVLPHLNSELGQFSSDLTRLWLLPWAFGAYRSICNNFMARGQMCGCCKQSPFSLMHLEKDLFVFGLIDPDEPQREADHRKQTIPNLRDGESQDNKSVDWSAKFQENPTRLHEG